MVKVYEINVDGHKVTINLKKHGYEPNYQRIEIRTTNEKMNFIYKDRKYIQVN